MRVKVAKLLSEKRMLLQERRWKRAIRKLEKVMPLWSYHAERLRLTMCRGWNSTAAVDGVSLFWNPEFTASLNDKQLLFLLTHEVFHVAAGHLWRGQKYLHGLSGSDLHQQADLWNQAADYAIHQILKPLIDSGDYSAMEFIASGLYDIKYDRKGAESIYLDLKAELQKRVEQGPGEPGNGAPGGAGSGSEGAGGSSSGSSEKGASKSGASKSGAPGNDGSEGGKDGTGSGGGQKVLDTHILRGEGDAPEGATQGDDGSWVMITDQSGNPVQPGKDDPKPEPMDPRGLRRQIQRDVNDAKLEHAASVSGRGYGTGNCQTPDTVNAVGQSQQNWDVLKRFVIQCAQSDYSYARPNRSYLGRGLIVPGLRSGALKIKIAIDTSSSISKSLLNRFGVEVEGIRSQLGDHELELITCSTRIPKDVHGRERTQVVRTGEEINWDIVKGGGTSFVPVFDYIQNQGDSPMCLLYFTDGEGAYPPGAPNYPVLWAMPHDAHVVPPFGEVVKLTVV